MNRFYSLVKIQLKNFLGKTISSLNIKYKSFAKMLLLLLPIAISLPIFNLSLTAFMTFGKLGQPELVITLTYIGAVMLMFFLGVPFIVSIFFYSRDIQFLSALPLKEEEIVFSKLSTVYFYLLAIAVIVMGPSLFVFGMNTAVSFLYIIKAVAVLLLVPLLPMLIAAVIVMLMSSFLINSSHRNLFALLSNFILIGSVITLQVIVNRYSSDPEQIKALVENGEGLLNVLGMRFPPSIWLTKMFVGSISDTILFLGLNVILIYSLFKLSRLFYRKAIISLQQGGRASGTIDYKKRGRNYQLIKRHFLIIFKEPTFLINTLFTLILPLVLFVVMSFSGEISKDILNSSQLVPYHSLIFIIIIVSPVIVSNIGSTIITREGKSFWQTKVLPISYKKNIKTRIYATVILTALGSVLMGLFALYLLNLSLSAILIGTLFGISVILFFSVIDLIINLYRPFLNWSNPTAAVKNNLNVMIALGLRAIIAAGFYGIYKLAENYIINNINIVLLIAAAVFFVLYLGARYFLYNKLIVKFKKITS